jgi:hypothetical protein
MCQWGRFFLTTFKGIYVNDTIDTNKLRENIMENKLQNLFSQCVEELKSIGIDINNNKLIGEINISLAKRNAKRYGCCRHEDPDEKYKVITKKGYKRYITYERFNKNYIEISKWVMELNDDIIKNTIMHEIIHCFPYCNNHGKEFKKYAGYINTHLGYSVSRLGNKEEDYKKSNLEYDIPQTTPNYKYKIECQKCGKYFFRQRYNKNLTITAESTDAVTAIIKLSIICFVCSCFCRI